MTMSPPERAVSARTAKWLSDRGISRQVWEARPYEDFVDAETTRALFPLEELARNQLADLSKMVNWMEGGKGKNDDPGGIIIHRIAPPGVRADHA